MEYIKLKNLKLCINRDLEYTFAENSFLVEAFTHKSISKDNYERYEFLGDAILRLSITKKIYQMYPKASEGELSREVQRLISKDTLSKLVLSKKLLEFLDHNDLKLDIASSLTKSLSADLVESLIGAIYIDSNFETADRVIIKIYENLLEKKDVIGQKDPKTMLQEYTQSKSLPLPKYHTKKLSGPPHAPGFRVSCVIENYSDEISTLCSTVQEGQQEVAELLLKKLEKDE
tara:strand:- start:141 stop:833 length:693 start_codon:yes stop_codon:yes gene_type:complete